MAYKKKTPRGDATPVKKMNGEYQPYPYGPTQKLKQANKHLPGQRKGYNC